MGKVSQFSPAKVLILFGLIFQAQVAVCEAISEPVSDQKCLKQIRSEIIQASDLPAAFKGTEFSGISIAGDRREREQLYRYTRNYQIDEILGLGYEFVVKADARTSLYVTRWIWRKSYRADDYYSLDSHYYLVRDSLPVLHVYKGSDVNSSCQLEPVRLIVDHYRELDGSRLEFSREDSYEDGSDQGGKKVTTRKVPKIEALVYALVNADYSPEELKQTYFFNLNSFARFDPNSSVPVVSKFGEAQPLRIFNPNTQAIETLHGVEMNMIDGYLGIEGSTWRIFENSSGYRLTETLFKNGSVQRYETLKYHLWAKTELLPKSGGRSTSVTGAKAKQSSKSWSGMRVAVLDDNSFPNIGAYYSKVEKVDVTNGKATFVISQPILEDSQSVAWETLEPDQSLLRDTGFMRVTAIGNWAKRIRPQLKGLTRVQAMKVLRRELNANLKYAEDWLEDGRNTYFLNSEEILARKSGVCHSYALVLATLARALGIPARVMSGFLLKNGEPIHHAWAEFKTDHDRWLPIEPIHRFPGNDRLSSFWYVPTGVFDLYEGRQTEQRLYEYYPAEIAMYKRVSYFSIF